MITRRELMTGASAGLVTWTLLSGTRVRAEDTARTLERKLTEIEAGTGGRLGVAVLDASSGLRASHRGDEPFPLCSTFKLLAAAAILARVDAREESLDRAIEVRQEDIVTYSPETETHVGQTMPLGDICAAALTLSDNAAGNLMLAAIGGPRTVTAYARSLGDTVTRLDRTEPQLNDVSQGDPRDTTTPSAMAADVQALVTGDALSPKSRAQLVAWLIANKTGDARLRAGIPAGWRIGDKTGTCNGNTANDVAVVWPPGGAPLIIAAYLTGATVDRDRQSAALADVGRAVATAIG